MPGSRSEAMLFRRGMRDFGSFQKVCGRNRTKQSRRSCLVQQLSGRCVRNSAAEKDMLQTTPPGFRSHLDLPLLSDLGIIATNISCSTVWIYIFYLSIFCTARRRIASESACCKTSDQVRVASVSILILHCIGVIAASGRTCKTS